MALAPDPSDKPIEVIRPERMHAIMLAQTLDAAADGNFGGKHTTNRRAGYSKTVKINGEELTELEWLIRRAKKDHTLASGEGRKIVEHYEAEVQRLRNTVEAIAMFTHAALLETDDDPR